MARKTTRTSSRDRLNRLQAEAAANESEKKAKKATKTAAKKTTTRRTRTRATAEPARMRYVWQVHVKGDVVAQFGWSERAEAAAEAARLSQETKAEHEVVKAKVPMEA